MSEATEPRTFTADSGGSNAFEGDGQISLGELIVTLWEGRFLILGSLLIALLLGGYYGWRARPIFQVNALLQIEDKKGGKGGPGMEALAGLMDQPTVAQAEIEIIKSNLVLGRTVEALALDIQASPDFGRLMGDARVRNRPDAPELLIERFDLPSYFRGVPFRLIALENGIFRWEGPDHSFMATGKVGDTLRATYRGQPLELKVRRLAGQTGQRYSFVRRHMLLTIEALRYDLQVAEKGKQTNILGLRFEHGDPIRGAEILNEILGQYVRQNIERKAEEASQTLNFLQDQLPQLRGKLDVAEEHLNQFRMQSGSVDLPEEAKLLLKQSVDLQGQILVLKQKKSELLRTYKEDADVVTTLNQQMAKLQMEATQVEGKVRVLPRVQQEVIRLVRDVQVNTDLYTALLNNVQQLQVARAGEIGNARIVDHAMPSLEPMKPKKGMVIGLAGLLGLFVGIGLTFLRRVLHQGVEDPRIIEGRLGLPVVTTIPHSAQQETEDRNIRRRKKGDHLLAKDHPEDLAVESLRSLRTSLHFTMMDAPNRVIAISGPSPSIGKSFVSSNFAAVLAQAGQRVLLIDGDMRRGSIHRYFGLSLRINGLSEILSGQIPWQEATRDTEVSGLQIITSGVVPPNPSELLMSSRFSAFIREVSEAYDIVLIDTPPVLAVTDAVIIGSRVGTVLLLVKSKAHPFGELQATIKRFESAGIKPKGCVFNDVPAMSGGNRYYRYAYHYGYKK